MDALQSLDLKYFNYFSPRACHVQNSKSASSSKSTPYNLSHYKTLDKFIVFEPSEQVKKGYLYLVFIRTDLNGVTDIIYSENPSENCFLPSQTVFFKALQ